MVFEGEAGVTDFTALWKVRVSTRSVYEIIMGRKSMGKVFREREHYPDGPEVVEQGGRVDNDVDKVDVPL